MAGPAIIVILAVTRGETCMSNIAVFALAGSILAAAVVLSWSHANAASGDNVVGFAASGPGTLYELRRAANGGTQVCRYTVEDTGGRLQISRNVCS